MAGRLLKFEELSLPEIQVLDKEKSALFFSFSPLEGHGPHLPLGVDYFNAAYFAEVAARRMLEVCPDFNAVLFPACPLGTALYKLPGSMRIEASTLYKIVAELGGSAVHWGFKYLFVFSGHGSPRHLTAIEAACRKVSRRSKIRMYLLLGALTVKFLKGEFTEKIASSLSKSLSTEDKQLLSKDIHGGWWETSMTLLLRPDLVLKKFKRLPHTQKGVDDIQNHGYYGSPSKASEEFAKVSTDVLMSEAQALMRCCLAGEDILAQTTSPFYKIPTLRPNFRRNAIILGLVVTVAVLIAIVCFCW